MIFKRGIECAPESKLKEVQLERLKRVVAMECLGQDGLHLFSDVFYPEVIDPETEQPVDEGERGELTITTLTKEAIPLLRYRTGDIVTITHEPCPHCGRTSPRTIERSMGKAKRVIDKRNL